jgi:hypothetical protein
MQKEEEKEVNILAENILLRILEFLASKDKELSEIDIFSVEAEINYMITELIDEN